MSTHLKLAITTIGDLLLNNAITRDKDDKPISDMKLVIPNYQRPYKWTAKKAIQLLDDIVDAKNENKETYRLGTLILHQDQNKSKETYNIVDGQQRIITFTLLLKAINTDLNIDFLEQPLTGNPHNIRNIPNNYLALERRVSKFRIAIQ